MIYNVGRHNRQPLISAARHKFSDGAAMQRLKFSATEIDRIAALAILDPMHRQPLFSECEQVARCRRVVVWYLHVYSPVPPNPTVELTGANSRAVSSPLR